MATDSDNAATGTRQLTQALAGKLTEADWSEIVRALVESAKSGNASAARLLVQARFGPKRWLSPATEQKESVGRRKGRLLKILKTQTEEFCDDRDGTDTTAGEVRVG